MGELTPPPTPCKGGTYSENLELSNWHFRNDFRGIWSVKL